MADNPHEDTGDTGMRHNEENYWRDWASQPARITDGKIKKEERPSKAEILASPVEGPVREDSNVTR